jgi:hypothetical protein
MKKTVITSFLWILFVPFAFSQNGDHVDGGDFLKRIEYNMYAMRTAYNFDSKGDIEKLFFGDLNASVEFFYEPSFEASVNGPVGFRVVRDSLDRSYVFEIKYISNYEDVYRKVWDRYRSMANSDEKYKLVKKEQIKLFKVETLSHPISDKFAEKLYKKMVSLIDNFKAKGVPPTIFDGYSVTFRTVVDDEVWSLKIHIPQGNSLKMADICRQIIAYDIETYTFKEAEYIKLLDAL